MEDKVKESLLKIAKNEWIINLLEEAYNLGKEEEKWVSVKTRLPEGEVLLLTKSGKRIIGDLYNGEWRTHLSEWVGNKLISAFAFDDITHFQPLPLAPRL